MSSRGECWVFIVRMVTENHSDSMGADSVFSGMALFPQMEQPMVSPDNTQWQQCSQPCAKIGACA